MGSGIYIASAGAVAQSDALDVTANNLANANTTGFRGDRVSFGAALARAQSPDVALVGVAEARPDTSVGTFEATENPLDLALDGDGFFAVETPGGVRYTRAGDFRLGPNGAIVNGDGFAARAVGGGTITVPEGTTSILVDAEGAVYADDAEVGRLELSRFAQTSLAKAGGNLFAARGQPLPAAAEGEGPRVVSGALESSNVNMVRGVIDLVKVSRTYESLMRMIEGFKEVETRAAREIGGPK